MFFMRGAVLPADRPPQRGPADPQLHGLRTLRPRGHRHAPRDRRPVPLLPRADLRPRLRSAPRCPTRSRRAGAASPRTTSTRCTTWRCSASPTTRRCRCAWRPWPGSPSSVIALLVALVYLVLKLDVVGHVRPRPRAAGHRRVLLRAACSSSSSASSASTSGRSTRRSTIGRWWSRRSASTSTEAGPRDGGVGRHVALRRPCCSPRSPSRRAVALVLTWRRLFFGMDLQDESYYILVPWRWALGDKPFVDEENLAQVVGFLEYPFIKAFEVLRGGDVTGLVLYGRHLYLVPHGSGGARASSSHFGGSSGGNWRCRWLSCT